MGNTYRNIFVQTADEGVLRDAIVTGGHDACLLRGEAWSVVFPNIRIDDQFWVNQQKLARALSLAGSGLALSAYVHDSDFLLFELWRAGEWLGGYASSVDIAEPAFTGLTAEGLATAFGRPQVQEELTRLLERKPSKRGEDAAMTALCKEYEGRWQTPEFHARFTQLVTQTIMQAREAPPPPFVFAEDRHQELCAALGLPGEAVGADYKDVKNGEADIKAIHIKARRTRG